MVYRFSQKLALIQKISIRPCVRSVPAVAAVFLCALTAPAAAAPVKTELQRLLETHPRLMSVRKRITSSEHRIRAARSGYLPSVSLSGDTGKEYVDSPSRRSTEGKAFFDTRKATTLTITQNLFDGFGTGSSTRIAELGKEVAQETYHIAEQTILFDGVRAYVNVLKQSKLIEIAKQNEQTLQEQLQLESARVERGSGLAVDVLQAKSRLQLARERVVTIQGDLRQAQSAYVELFDRPANPAAMQIPDAPPNQLPETLDGAVEIAVNESAVIRRSENAVDIASEQRTVAEATYWPRLDLVSEGSWEKDVDGIAGTRREGRLILRAEWDIFDGFLTPARSAAASSDYRAALDVRLDTDRDVRDRVRRAWAQFRTTADQRDLLQNAVNIAAEVFEARRKLRQRGRESVINLLDAENELNTARLRYTDARFNHVIAAYRLLLQVGRLDADTLDLKRP